MVSSVSEALPSRPSLRSGAEVWYPHVLDTYGYATAVAQPPVPAPPGAAFARPSVPFTSTAGYSSASVRSASLTAVERSSIPSASATAIAGTSVSSSFTGGTSHNSLRFGAADESPRGFVSSGSVAASSHPLLRSADVADVAVATCTSDISDFAARPSCTSLLLLLQLDILLSQRRVLTKQLATSASEEFVRSDVGDSGVTDSDRVMGVGHKDGNLKNSQLPEEKIIQLYPRTEVVLPPLFANLLLPRKFP